MNSFDSKGTLVSGGQSYTIYRLPTLTQRGFNLSRLPFSLKILLENLLRREDGVMRRPSRAGRLPICRRGC